MVYLIKLECGHKVVTDVELRLQYPTDSHYIYCPTCRNVPIHPALKINSLLTAWNPVVSLQEVNHDKLFNVYGQLPYVVSRDILRLQPSVSAHRKRPFPYVNLKQTGTRGRGRR